MKMIVEQCPGQTSSFGVLQQVLQPLGKVVFIDSGLEDFPSFYSPADDVLQDSGRVYAGVPAPTNLTVPPHYFVSDDVILIGEDGVA